MIYYYIIEINIYSKSANIADLDALLQKNNPIFNTMKLPYQIEVDKQQWRCEIKRTEDSECFDFISFFSSMLKDNFKNLRTFGIKKEDITIWLLYEYDQQCNMEFSKHQLKKLASLGITFCISCWQKD